MNNAYQKELNTRAHESEMLLVDQQVIKQVLIFIQEIAGSAKKRDVQQIYPYPVSPREMSMVRTSLRKHHGAFAERVSLTPIDGKEGQETLITIAKKGK
jgi:hypothetical protein